MSAPSSNKLEIAMTNTFSRRRLLAGTPSAVAAITTPTIPQAAERQMDPEFAALAAHLRTLAVETFAKLEADTTEEDDHRSWDEIFEDLAPIVDKILLDWNAKTKEELAVQAFAVVLWHKDAWEDYPGVGAFVENICRFLGAPFGEAV